MGKDFKRIFIFILAVFFILLGIIGLVLPILQGVIFIVVGLLLLSLYSPRLRASIDKHTVRYPKIHKVVLQAEEWVVKIVGRPE